MKKRPTAENTYKQDWADESFWAPEKRPAKDIAVVQQLDHSP